MSDEFKPLIVEGEEVGDYNDTTYSYGKWQMATVELWESPKEFDAYQYGWDTFKEFYKPDDENYKYVDCEDKEWIKDEYYFIVHWRRYAIYNKEVYDGGESWCVEDMGESNPERYYYKDGKIEEGWSTPMEEEE